MTPSVDYNEGNEEDGVVRSVRSTWLRWLMLAFGSMFLMGSYFCYDNPLALSLYLEDCNNAWCISKTKVNLLYSVYSLPNIILPLLGGIFLDKIGVK